MDFKNISPKILASILGIIIIGSIVNLFLVIILTIFFITVKPESISDLLWIIHSLIGLSIIIAGIYIGLKSYKSKNIWYTIFKPTKNKAFISLILSIILVISSLVFFGGKSFVNVYTFKPISVAIAIPLTIISYFIAFYPFSALCNFTFQYKKDKLFKKSKTIMIIFSILLNPIFIVIGAGIGAIYTHGIMNEPCGIKIAAFNEPSPAKEVGMRVNEIIVKINNIEVVSLNDLKDYMGNYNPSMDLILYTKSNSYDIKPVLVDRNYLLGVNLTQEMCKRSLRK